MEKKKGFWRSFTLKGWIINFILTFPFFFLGDFVDVVVIDHEDVKNIFAAKQLLKNIFMSAFFSFWLTVWTEKSETSRWLNKSKESKPS